MRGWGSPQKENFYLLIKVKVKREGRKDLKIGVLNAPKKMKFGQLWSMVLVMKEAYLRIQEAKYLQD